MKQKKSRTHIIFISIITLAICISTVNQTIPAIAKSNASSKKISISRSSLKMKPGTQKKLTIKNSRKKVKWSSSNRKVAVIKSKTGKYKNKAVIRAKASGTCTITAKSGSLKRKCKVRVLKENDTNSNTDGATGEAIAGIQFESVSVTTNSISVTVKIYNNSKKEINYGLACMIEKQIDGKWTVLETTEPQVIPSIACIVDPGSSRSDTFVLANLKDPVTNGNYRITLTAMSKAEPPSLTKVINSATFQITNRD